MNESTFMYSRRRVFLLHCIFIFLFTIISSFIVVIVGINSSKMRIS